MFVYFICVVANFNIVPQEVSLKCVSYQVDPQGPSQDVLYKIPESHVYWYCARNVYKRGADFLRAVAASSALKTFTNILWYHRKLYITKTHEERETERERETDRERQR